MAVARHRCTLASVAVRLLIVDDNEPFRSRLVELLTTITGVELVGTAGDAATAIDQIERERPDAIVLDMFMPGGGLSVLEHARRSAAPPCVAVLTASPTDQHRRRCLALGAELFLDKATDLDELTDWLRALAAAP
jgi:DNA-binding NarL/FixJ family response regulator